MVELHSADASSHRVAIIGGGASGALAAIAFARLKTPSRVTVFEPRLALGHGFAYSTTRPEHLLNVPAGRMSVDLAVPGDFVAWCVANDVDATAETFVPRRSYGRYLTERAGHHATHVPTKVVDVERRADGRLDVVQPSGARLAFDDVIVATGYGPTPGQRKFAHVESPLVVRDPYAAGALDVIPARGAILVVGTGLAAIDVILTLGTERPSQPIVAISRRGRTPALHHTTSTSSPLDWHAESRTARELVREVRVTIDAVETEGGDWRTVFDALRHQVPDIWRALPLRESQRLLRHARRPWELHRHRLAPAVASQFNRLLTGGRVCIKRGTPVDVTAAMDRLSVTIMGQGTTSVVEAAAMVLCTGAVDHDWVGADPLLARLVERSLAAPHPLDIGPDVGPTGRFIGPDGEPVAGLWTIGPLRRAAEWETTAIPEIRRQAAQLAALISASSPPPQEIEPVQIRLVR